MKQLAQEVMEVVEERRKIRLLRRNEKEREEVREKVICELML